MTQPKKCSTKSCSKCAKCYLYEDENSRPSDIYACQVKGELIDDIYQDCCCKFEPEDENTIFN